MKISKIYDLFMAAHKMNASIQHGRRPQRAVMREAGMPESVIERLGA